ncbi:MAG: hypothetical protein H6R00_586 [Proteobacteria bacterium]|nr:hypothetical protein [Pseudomonadota bacterium]
MNSLASDALHFAFDNLFTVILGVPFLAAAIFLHFLKPTFKLGRAGYFCAFGVTLLVWRLAGPLGSVVAKNEGSVYFPFWVLAVYLCLIVTGILLGLASSARAMDAYNHRTYWFLGFIPIANLSLLLKRPRQRRELHVSQLAGNALLIGTGCLMLGTFYLPADFFAPAMVAFVGRGEYDRILDGDVTQQEGYKRVFGVYLQGHIDSIRPPRNIDEDEVFVGKEIDGTTIRLIFERGNNITYKGSMAWLLQESFEVCRDPRLGTFMDMGATVERRYVTHQGGLLDTVTVTAAICPTVPEAVSEYIQVFAGLAKRGIRIDDETISSNGNYADKLMTVDFKYSGDIGKLSMSYIQKSVCSHPIFANITRFDVSVQGVYKSDKGEDLGEATVDYNTCQALKKG